MTFGHLVLLFAIYRTEDVAQAFLRTIEEDHHDQQLLIQTPGGDGVIFVEDDTIRFRREIMGAGLMGKS